ncbi:MAG: glycosyl transferase, partial [Alphaproteobacteria bacterium]|nr:glycosyl transferase [Alphaproteobacteria bacterium]
MLTWNTIFILCAAAALVSCVGTRFVLKYLLKHEILDVPNERSSHSTPVPRGGGIAVIGALILSWAVMTVLASIGENKNEFGNGIYIILACGAGLAIMSWIDDKRNLSPLFRLGGHFMAAILGITVFPADTLFFHGHLPLFLDWTLAAVLWVWFINLYNFMDGIDGITGVETASIGFALALMASSGALPLYLGGYGLIAAVIALGFIFWNWFPAKIFLGDVGSVPLGFFMGWLLLVLVANGMWCA